MANLFPKIPFRSFLVNQCSCMINRHQNATATRGFHVGSMQNEMKKKFKEDPAAVRAKIDKKIRRLNKGMRKLNRNERRLMPIEENDSAQWLKVEVNKRQRKLADSNISLSADEESEIVLSYAKYACEQGRQEVIIIDDFIIKQRQAMEELERLAPEFHRKALEVDESLLTDYDEESGSCPAPPFFPIRIEGPKQSIPIVDYIQDGAYEVKKLDLRVDYEDMKIAAKNLAYSGHRKKISKLDD